MAVLMQNNSKVTLHRVERLKESLLMHPRSTHLTASATLNLNLASTRKKMKSPLSSLITSIVPVGNQRMLTNRWSVMSYMRSLHRKTLISNNLTKWSRVAVRKMKDSSVRMPRQWLSTSPLMITTLPQSLNSKISSQKMRHLMNMAIIHLEGSEWLRKTNHHRRLSIISF